MSFNLRNRSLLAVQDYTPREFRYLLDLARDLKRAKYARTEQKHLKGKEICLIFEKTSTRTRCAFEVACYDQGAHVTYLDPSGSQLGHKESFKDTARVLGGSEFTQYGIVEYPQRRAMSLQSHPEFSPEYAAALIELRRSSKYSNEQADRALQTLRQPNDRARVGAWLAQFLRSNVCG